MAQRTALDLPLNAAEMLNEAWPSGKPPQRFDRSGRVRLLGEFAVATLAGRQPSRAAAMFVAGAIAAWLEQGGSLETTFLQVTAQPGSHRTPAFVWQTLCDDSSSRGEQGPEDSDTVEAPSTEGEL